MGKNTQKFVSPVNNRAQISASLSTHIFEQVKSDLLKEISASKSREGNQGPPENRQVAQQSGRKEERKRGENSIRNSPEHQRGPQGTLGRAEG